MDNDFKNGFEKVANAFTKAKMTGAKLLSSVAGAASKATKSIAPGMSKKLDRTAESAGLISKGKMPLSHKKDVVKGHRGARDRAPTRHDRDVYNESSRQYMKTPAKDMPQPRFKSPKDNKWQS